MAPEKTREAGGRTAGRRRAGLSAAPGGFLALQGNWFFADYQGGVGYDARTGGLGGFGLFDESGIVSSLVGIDLQLAGVLPTGFYGKKDSNCE